MKLREALLIGLELIDGGALILQTLLKRLRWRILKPQHVVFLFPARELFTKFRIVQKRQIVLKPLLLLFENAWFVDNLRTRRVPLIPSIEIEGFLGLDL